MSEVVSYAPTPLFKEAASYLSNASGLSKVTNETMLELYGLYKFLTVSAEPTTARPSIFSPTERAKYDAWKSAGLIWRGNESQAEDRYKEIAGSLGWSPGITIETSSPQSVVEPTAEELLEGDANNDSQGGASGAMGLNVSIIKRDGVDEEQSLHSIAINGDIQELEAFLELHQDIDINAVDEYGFTALHLACDRGNTETVKTLLRKRANASLKDSDGLSALDLALEANHADIAALLTSPMRDSI